MFVCPNCAAKETRLEKTKQMFWIDDKPVLVSGIPVQVCTRCGEETFDVATGEKIRRLLHGQGRPIRTLQTEVFAFS